MNAIQALVPLRNDLPPLENSIIRMVMLVALAERAVQEDNQSIWLQNNDLNKRRATYHYDNHLMVSLDDKRFKKAGNFNINNMLITY